MPQIETVVEAISQSGVLLGDGEWADWTRIPEKAAELAKVRPNLRKGDVVRAFISPKTSGKGRWVNSLEILDPSQDVTPPAEVPFEYPAPRLGDSEPESRQTPPEAPQMGPMEQGEVQYLRIAALNAAVSLAPSATQWAEQPLDGQKALILHLADEFEDWLGR